MWIECTSLKEDKVLICLDRVDWISTGYEKPGCAFHFFGGAVASVSEDLETVQRLIKRKPR